MPKFIARCSNQVLCIKPKKTVLINGFPEVTEGEHIRFENGEFETNDKKEIEFIRKHRFFGTSIFEDKKAEAPPAAQ